MSDHYSDLIVEARRRKVGLDQTIDRFEAISEERRLAEEAFKQSLKDIADFKKTSEGRIRMGQTDAKYIAELEDFDNYVYEFSTRKPRPFVPMFGGIRSHKKYNHRRKKSRRHRK
jgi:hypothetical protein